MCLPHKHGHTHIFIDMCVYSSPLRMSCVAFQSSPQLDGCINGGSAERMNENQGGEGVAFLC